jgi:hypothetical protein
LPSGAFYRGAVNTAYPGRTNKLVVINTGLPTFYFFGTIAGAAKFNFGLEEEIHVGNVLTAFSSSQPMNPIKFLKRSAVTFSKDAAIVFAATYPPSLRTRGRRIGFLLCTTMM